MNGAPTVSLAQDSDSGDWNRLVENLPHGNFYQRFEWRRINREALGHDTHYLAARHGGELTGVLPLVFVRSRLFARALCSLPFVNFGGPCARDADTERALIDAALQKARELGADYLELRNVAPLPTDMPVSLRKISMTLELQADPEKLWNAFNTKHRTQIRRIYKNGLTVKHGGAELLDTFYELMRLSWRSLGTPLYRKSYFAAILAAFPADTRIFICHQGDRPVAAAFNGYHAGTVEGMWAAADPAARELQPNYVLYWEMIQEACRRGCRLYHLGRSTADSGGEQFKKKWNAESRQLHWYFGRPGGGTALPDLNVDNPKYRLAIATWRKLPLWVTDLAGPPLARLIP
jgi:FemAB-related protein (PEP-CTERM system-associated)